jgi:uncharacterized membrane protein YsdA (DUF1294 family)
MPRVQPLAFVPIVAFVVGYLLIDAAWGVPVWVAGVYVVGSILAVVLYRIDKSAAGTRRRRIPEATLLFVGVIGGWPGAIIGQQLFRHKTIKKPFVAAFWVSVVANVAVFVAFTTPVTQLLR